MKGILTGKSNGDIINWIVSYYEEVEDSKRLVELQVRPHRIDDLNRVGTYLKNGDEVDFQIEHTEYFPYRLAVPYVDETNQSIPMMAKRKKKVNVITVYVAGFPFDEEEITCDGYDASSSGYWYFWDYENGPNSTRKYIGAYPIERTVIHKIVEQEIEY